MGYDDSTHSCSADAAGNENSEQLDVKSMSGALVIHGIAWVASLVFLLFKRAKEEKRPSANVGNDVTEFDPTQKDAKAILLAIRKDVAKVVACLEVGSVECCASNSQCMPFTHVSGKA